MTIPATIPDLGAFFNANELAQSVTLDGGASFLAVFTEFYDALEIGFADMSGTSPMFICKSSDVPGAADGGVMVIGGVTYVVREVLQSNAGLTRIRAEIQ
jgi:hypothetical protein